MTDRIRTLTVVLDHDVRTDDAEHYVQVLSAIKGVASVTIGKPLDYEDFMARSSVGREHHSVLSELSFGWLKGKRMKVVEDT